MKLALLRPPSYLSPHSRRGGLMVGACVGQVLKVLIAAKADVDKDVQPFTNG